jgi:hypothetical protein
MSKIAISGASTGTATFTIESPATSTNRTLTLPDNTGTIITQNSTPAFASTIGVGGATPAASGAGITFPATQSASSNANTLDDYEEGTWTPIFVQSGTSYTYANQDGRYTKIGRTVFCQWRINLTTHTGTTGAASVSVGGFPFTSANYQGGSWVAYNNNSGLQALVGRNDNVTTTVLVGFGAVPTNANIYGFAYYDV